MADKVVVDCISRTTVATPLTPEEQAEFDARHASIEARRGIVLDRVRTVTQAKVNAVAGPEWRQRDMLARSVELIEKKTDGVALSTQEQNEMTAMRNARNAAKTKRQEGMALEDQARAATSHADLDAIEAQLA